jgi:3-oxoacyl-[acyl-carrier protein] reductase
LDLGLEGKVALVAGGSSGIGLAVATELAREGAHVAIAGRDADRLQAAVQSLREVGGSGRITGSSLDLTDPDAARRWVDEVAAEFGALHVVLISGSSPPIGPASRFELADYRAAVDRVLHPAINLALAAVGHLRAAGWGRLLFVASETAVEPIAPLVLSGITRAPCGPRRSSGPQPGWPATATAALLRHGWPPSVRTARSAGWPVRTRSARWRRSWPASGPPSSPAPCT